eukprot:jgi/Pico_ML_1/51715/g283.t1
MGAGGRTSTTSTMGRLAGEAVDALASFNAKKATPKEREGTKKDPNAVQTQAVNGRVPMAEVAKHNVPEDGWVVIKGKVYDVTKLAKVHPGGNVIYTQLGKDVTDVFSVFHDPHTWKLLKEMYVADLEPVEPTTVEEKKQNELLEDFRKMRMDMIRDGLFESNKWYYVLKVMTNVALVQALSLDKTSSKVTHVTTKRSLILSNKVTSACIASASCMNAVVSGGMLSVP